MTRSRSPFVVASLLSILAGSLPAQFTVGDAGTPLPPRAAPFAFFDQPRGRVTLFGGAGGGGVHLDDCWQLDDGAWVQVPVTAGYAVAYGACCEDPSGFGATVLYGGVDEIGTLSPQTRRWNRQTLRFDTLSPSTSPPARWVSAMAYDSARQRAVLFGGGSSWWLGDTWEWDGTNWQQRFPAQSPPMRSHHAMAFDAARGRVVLYGGHNGASLSDTWTYDGTTWTQMTGAGPGALHDPMLAYDSSRSVVVKFGGKTDAGVVNDQVWEWNGSTWTQKTPAGPRPTARELAAFVYDPQRRIVTLAGGTNGSTHLGDAWHWNGTAWTEAKPRDRGTLVVPPARFGATLGYNAVEDKLVLFGGFTLQGIMQVPLTDTWERAGEVWQQRTPSVTPPGAFANAGCVNRGTGSLCYVPGTDAFGNPHNEQWGYGSDGHWGAVTLNRPPLAPMHQVMGSLLSSHFGWILVRLVTMGSGSSQTSAMQLIVPGTGTAEPVFPSGGPPPLMGSSMTQSARADLEPDRVWLFGGVSQTLLGALFSNDVWELADTGTGGQLAWTRIVPQAGSPVPPPRRDASFAYWDSGGGLKGLLVSGGRDATGATLSDSWLFWLAAAPGTVHTWSALPPLSYPRARTAAASASRGHGVLAPFSASTTFGGIDGFNVFGDLWTSAGGAETPARVWSRPAPRIGSAIAYDRVHQHTLLFGGTDVGNDLWSYDGTTWLPMVAVGTTPPPRVGAAACFDEANAALVLFGGQGAQHLFAAPQQAETWVLSATGWSLRSAGPAKRERAAMAYIASSQRCLLFGGYDNGWSVFPPVPVTYGDTWLYDASTDQWQQGPSGPAPRYYHAMAYDRLRDCVVLFGGMPHTQATYDDTWEYRTATGWQQRQPAHRPQGLRGHTMVFDEARGRIVVTGGANVTPTSGWQTGSSEIWEWDGTDWHQRQPDTISSGRVGAATVYDVARSRSVSFGGATQYLSGFGELHQGITDDLVELRAPIDLAGRGNTANPEGLRFYSQPVLGQPLHLGFANPSGYAWGLLGLGPVSGPLASYPAPPACEPSSLFAWNAFSFISGAVEPNWTLNVPNSPPFIGQTVVVQGFVMQPASCWRFTDALHVRF